MSTVPDLVETAQAQLGRGASPAIALITMEIAVRNILAATYVYNANTAAAYQEGVNEARLILKVLILGYDLFTVRENGRRVLGRTHFLLLKIALSLLQSKLDKWIDLKAVFSASGFSRKKRHSNNRAVSLNVQLCTAPAISTFLGNEKNVLCTKNAPRFA